MALYKWRVLLCQYYLLLYIERMALVPDSFEKLPPAGQIMPLRSSLTITFTGSLSRW